VLAVVIGAAAQAVRARVEVELVAVERDRVAAEPVVEQGLVVAEPGPVGAERGPVAAPAREVEVVQALAVEVALGEEPQAAEESVSLVEGGELAPGAGSA
jgi:hypothetical protein